VAFLSCTDRGRAPETRNRLPSGEAMTCRFMPWRLCLPGVEGPVGGDPVDRDRGPVHGDAGAATAAWRDRTAREPLDW
jgi:hypothetical protein